MDNKKLSKQAYGGIDGKDYVPYISSSDNKGGNLTILIIGIMLTVLFAVSTAYSGMKAGLTVAAGIPGTILGAFLVNLFAKKKGLLGTNILQGMSSGGESIASGIIFVMPALVLIGSQLNFLQGVLAGFSGVLIGLGVASVVHNYLIVEEHGKLKYPESMAISEALVVSESGGESLKYMGIGFAVGGIITAITEPMTNAFNNVVSYIGSDAYKWRFQIEVNPLLLGIGFIVGLEVAVTMFAGSILANFAVNPLIGYFASFAEKSQMVWNNPKIPLAEMEPSVISLSYGRYIGAGMMIYGGLVGSIKLIPVVVNSLKETMGAKSGAGSVSPIQKMIIPAGVVVVFITSFIISQNPMMAIISAIVSFILMFLFVIVAGRLTGTIGTSNLPVSGMTIASLVILTLIFVSMGWTTKEDNSALLMFGTLIVTAIATAGGYMQTQKATFIIGGRKDEIQRYYLIAALIGVVAVVGTILILKDQFLPVNGKESSFDLPQANIMATLTSGIMGGNLPWAIIFAGIAIAAVIHLLKLPIMSVAIGFYLPISTSSIILIGALVKVVLEYRTKNKEELDARVSNGVSLSSGLVAGGSIIGLLGIILTISGAITPITQSEFAASNTMAIILLVLMVVAMALPILYGKIKK